MGKYKVLCTELVVYLSRNILRATLSHVFVFYFLTVRDPSWFIPSMRTTQMTLRVRSPKGSPPIQPSKPWSESTSSRYQLHVLSFKMAEL